MARRAIGIVVDPFDDEVKAAVALAQVSGIEGTGEENLVPGGVFSRTSAGTPKWTRGTGPDLGDFRESMARMFIQLSEGERKRFLDSVARTGDKDSRTLAAVLAGTGKAGSGTGYIDFLLQSAQHSFQEKTQIVETLADNFVIYYFGQGAVPFSYSGTLLNTWEDDQGANMFRIYRDMIRGTQLARRRKLLRLRYNNMIVAGSAMNFQFSLTAETETALPFSFQLMPHSITLLDNPDFGVVVLNSEFESLAAPVIRSHKIVSAQVTPAPGSVVADDGSAPEEVEADASLTTGQTLQDGFSAIRETPPEDAPAVTDQLFTPEPEVVAASRRGST